MKHRHSSTSALNSRRSSQRGVVLLFSLIALVILLIAAVALVRSFNTSLFTAGNIAFKRDLQNQGERAMDKVLTQFRTGGVLASQTARNTDSTTYHYKASMLPTNALGIPTALQSATAYALVADAATDIKESTDASLTGQAVSIQYVVDRLCTAGTTIENPANCQLSNNPVPSGTSSSNIQSAERAGMCATCVPATPQGVVYRLTVKVTGPRNTQSFFQSTFTVPSNT